VHRSGHDLQDFHGSSLSRSHHMRLHPLGAPMRRTTPLYPRRQTSGSGLHFGHRYSPCRTSKYGRPRSLMFHQGSESELRKRESGPADERLSGTQSVLPLVLQEAGHLLLREHGHAADQAGARTASRKPCGSGHSAPLARTTRSVRTTTVRSPSAPAGPAPPSSGSGPRGPPARTRPARGPGRARERRRAEIPRVRDGVPAAPSHSTRARYSWIARAPATGATTGPSPRSGRSSRKSPPRFSSGGAAARGPPSYAAGKGGQPRHLGDRTAGHHERANPHARLHGEE
jgi:hypothetical protein